MKKSLKLSSDLQNLRVIEKMIDDISLSLDLSDEVYGNVLVATIEAANNAIIHGNKLDPEKKISVDLEVLGSELKVAISDQGNGFDFEHVPDPTAPENREKINGRGVFLMQRLSDGILFKDNGRFVELTFNIL
ncbi:MAG: ATP-binding protein [Bacteroidota bacterium]